MPRPILSAALVTLLLSACSGSSDPVVEPRAESEDGGTGTATGTGGAWPADFHAMPDALDQATQRAAELTREACFADYMRLASLLGTPSSIERFHPVDDARVDVEWVEPGSQPVQSDGPVGVRQGAGAVLEGRRDENGNALCTVSPYESHGLAFAPADAEPMTLARIDGATLACAPDTVRPGVVVENIPLFLIEDRDGAHAYGSMGRRYALLLQGEWFRTESLRKVTRRTLDPEHGATYVVACSAPERLPDGQSILVAPTDPTNPAGPLEPFDGPSAFVDRPWQATARTAQETVDAHGVLALRQAVERSVLALGPVGADTLDVACPLGGSATLSARVDADQETHRYAFAACTLADGTYLNGVHDSDLQRQDEGDAIRRSREERFSLLVTAPDRALLEARGTLSDALTGKRADECGLLVQERVLRIDVPMMRIGPVTVSALAIEDITNARIDAAVQGGCGTQVREFAFSDSARVEQALVGGEVRRFTVNRTGSVLRDDAGMLSSSGSDAIIRIYDGDNDDSLDIAPDFSRTDGASVTIDTHPGRVMFADTWRFVER